MKYHHLNQRERDELAVLRGQGWTLRQIAERMGRSFSTLSRELRRNPGSDGYRPHTAQRKAEQRLCLSHVTKRLAHKGLREQVWRLLERGWSPELISGRLKRFHPELPSVSPEAIYQWIYRDRRDLIRYLACAHRKRGMRHWYRRSRVNIPGRISIRQRPALIETRQEAGHWETDLVVGPGPEALQVLVERQTRYSRLRKIPHRGASASRVALTHLMQTIPEALRKSITYDNGSENVEHLTLNDDFGLKSYFCEPYHSWEKGTVENTNGLIRRYIPKRTGFQSVSESVIDRLEKWLNDRPRKVLDFKTPREVFQALLLH